MKVPRVNAAFILALACAEDDGTGEGCPAADRVDDRRACEVEEAELRVEEAAAPLPGSLDRVEEGREDDREDQEGPQLDAFCERARHDGRGRGAEHELEEEVRTGGGVAQVVGCFRRDANSFQNGNAEGAEIAARFIGADGPAAQRVHEVVADEIVHDRRDAEERDVLGQLHRHVLGADEASFEHGEACRHPEHQEAADEEQQRVEDEDRVLADGRGGLDDSFRCRFCVLREGRKRDHDGRERGGPENGVL
jgi:hypothetical protein